MNKTKIYLLPHWAVDTLQRQQLNASTILDFQKVRQYLSLSDIAGIAAMKKFDDYITGSKNSEFSSNISYEWSVSATPKDKSFLYEQLDPLSQDESVIEMNKVRLFLPEQGTGQTAPELDSSSQADSVSAKPYTIVHLDNNSLGVVLKAHGLTPGFLYKNRLSLISDILKQLYVYESSSAVAKSPLFVRYLELLMTN
jgi:hypothetical protein